MRRLVGSRIQSDTGYFCVWAPEASTVSLEIISEPAEVIPLKKDEQGYWQTQINGIRAGTLYKYRLDGDLLRPDPASLSQPQGVHGPSEVIDTEHFPWQEGEWKGMRLEQMIMYELHVGTFTPTGTFAGIIEKLDYLVELGINTIELMPLAQFPGSRNWGYDGVYPFAVQHTYGGAAGLKQLINTCHQKNIAVVIDVVYNHLGPEGSYLNDYSTHYFTDKYHTPWGKALNYDDAYCDPVRNFFLQNALMWLNDFHADGLRLDAVHAIKDLSAKHFLTELSREVEKLSHANGREYVLIAECDLNDTRFISGHEKGGYGLTGQWIDEFHHALHTVVTGELDGYYEDFGKLDHLVKAFEKTYVYDGIYSPHRKKAFGSSAEDHPFSRFVVFSQNHDHTGNRMLGERLTTLVSFEALKLIAGAVILSPYVPLLFMGEEYGETNPFLYFVSHTDPELVEAVREGRKREFAYFHKKGLDPLDPQAEDTYNKCKLSWNYKEENQEILWKFYQNLIFLRKSQPALQNFDRQAMEVFSYSDSVIVLHRKSKLKDDPSLYCVMNFSKQKKRFSLKSEGIFQKILDSSGTHWQGPGSLSPDTVSPREEINTIAPEAILVYKSK